MGGQGYGSSRPGPLGRASNQQGNCSHRGAAFRGAAAGFPPKDLTGHMPLSNGAGTLAARINDALPQTQCTRCGYPDCAAYAEAIAAAQAPINRCPPGGAAGIQRLAELTGQAAEPLDPAYGMESPRAVAVIDENWCIGCTLCLDACPTDAIVGANKLMHTVVAAHCTGCELCLPVCPVDCIALDNASGKETGWSAWSPSQAHHARVRYTARAQRSAPALQAGAATIEASPGRDKSAVIAAALARAKAQRSS